MIVTQLRRYNVTREKKNDYLKLQNRRFFNVLFLYDLSLAYIIMKITRNYNTTTANFTQPRLYLHAMPRNEIKLRTCAASCSFPHIVVT